MLFPMVQWTDDLGAADWLAEAMTTFAFDVTSVVPAGFAAYARLPHTGPDPDDRWRGALPPEQLLALAAALAPHARGTVWFAIWDGYGWAGDRGSFAVAGHDPAEVAAEEARLRTRREAFQTTLPTARLRLPERDYMVYYGTITEAAVSFGRHHANLWWPDDRSWCVATEIDLSTTYIAGSDEVIDAVVRIGAHRVAPEAPIGEHAGD